MTCVPPNRTTTTPIVAGSGVGSVCTRNTGYHNRRLVGGVFVTDVADDRISNTVTPVRIRRNTPD